VNRAARFRDRLAATLLAFCATLASAEPRADEAVWQSLAAGGLVVLVRHASTDPGVGDPPGFRLGDCATQRNLSEAGRAEARRIGASFRSRRIGVAAVRSSEWCRCRDTAEHAFGAYRPWAALNSFFNDRSTAARQRAEVLAAIREHRGSGNLVLVTHQVNITDLTGIVPASGEMVVVRPSRTGLPELVGRIPPPQ
jgi:phosphohistidine phosphatase SixA